MNRTYAVHGDKISGSKTQTSRTAYAGRAERVLKRANSQGFPLAKVRCAHFAISPQILFHVGFSVSLVVTISSLLWSNHPRAIHVSLVSLAKFWQRRFSRKFSWGGQNGRTSKMVSLDIKDEEGSPMDPSSQNP